MLSFRQMQSHGIIASVEPKVALSGARVSTKGSCVDPLGQDLNTNASDKHGLYADDTSPCLAALGRVYERSTPCTTYLWAMIW